MSESESSGADTAKTALSVRDVSVLYGRRRVLERVDLDVAPGEIFGLIGLNGVGKTTLIKTILDLAQAASGAVAIFGVDSRQPASRKAIAYLPEHLQPNRNLKGREFIDFSLAYFGVKLRDIEQQAAGLALDPAALGRRMSTYSKGMVQKAGLLATLLSERPLLILDEPMTGLDPRARILLKERLLAYRDNGGAVFFSSHILSDIDEICDRVGVIHDGRIVFSGTPEEMRQRFGAANLERAFLAAVEDHEARHGGAVPQGEGATAH